MDSGGGVSLDSHLIVVGWELMEQLFNAIFLSWAVHVGHLVLRQGAVVLMNLSKTHREDEEHTCNMASSVHSSLFFRLWNVIK